MSLLVMKNVKNSIFSNSTLSGLLVIQIFIVFLTFSIYVLGVKADIESKKRAIIRRVEENLSLLFVEKGDDILALAELNLQAALEEEILKVKSTFPISDVRVFTPGKQNLQSFSAAQTEVVWIYFPQHPKDTDTWLALKVDLEKASDQSVESSFASWLVAVVALGAVFSSFLSIGYLYFFLSRPLSGILGALKSISGDRGKALEDLVCFGEIREFKLDLARLLEDNSKLTISAAVAQTTQMLAHDVRKPFSMLKIVLECIQDARSPEEIKEVAEAFVPEVTSAIASVQGMLQDVMMIGSKTELALQEASPESLIEASLNEVFQIYPEADVEIYYELAHWHMVCVDALKVGRVFSNIVGNAVQAMKEKGKLWFKTREIEVDGKSWVEFCLGNSNSFIAEECIPKLFDAFFTSGKKGGTGLGLAIAQKIVNEHGGKIWCKSSQEIGVDFYFTLPCHTSAVQTKSNLLTHSNLIALKLNELRNTSSKHANEGEVSSQLNERIILDYLKRSQMKLKILIVDDEAVYRNALKSQLEANSELAMLLDVTFAVSAEQALTLYEGKSFDVCILDVDLGSDSVNGFDLVQALRKHGSRSQICVHSNRALSGDYKQAIYSGADAFLPKPMSRAHLLRLIAVSVSSELNSTYEYQP